MARLKTRTVRDRSELVAYFNQLAVAYAEGHGDADRLLEYRLELIRRCEGRSGVLLEIGCGTAVHLAKLASAFSQLIGADISSGMVNAAWRRVHTSPYRDRIELRVDPPRNFARSTTRPWTLCFVSGHWSTCSTGARSFARFRGF